MADDATESPEPPRLIITPNQAAFDILVSLLELEVPLHGDIPVWEATIPLRITRADLARFCYGNGDLVQVEVFPVEGGVEAVAFPDPDPPTSTFET